MTLHKGWVKLHRQIIDNDIWRDDPTAWRIFEYFLVSVDKDTGSMRYGRIWLSKFLNIPEGTVYSAIKRLKKAKMVNTTSNNKFSTISIVNWGKYQEHDNNTVNNKSTTNQHITINKNKESNKVVEYSPAVKYIADNLGMKITPTVIKVIDEDYKDYKIKHSIDKMAAEYKDVRKKVPTTLGLMNWLENGVKFGEVTRRDE